MPTAVDSRDVVARAIERDHEAFAELYRRFSPRVFRHVYYIVGTKHEADDLTSETFLRAWKAIDRYEDRGLSIEYWLLRIAHNTAAKYLKRRRPVISTGEIDIEADAGRSPERVLESSSQADAVRAAILRLRDTPRQVIVWRFLEDLSYDEVEKILGKSKATIRVIQYRALKQLRDLLEEPVSGVVSAPKGARRPLAVGHAG